jgi:hypothetical protein
MSFKTKFNDLNNKIIYLQTRIRKESCIKTYTRVQKRAKARNELLFKGKVLPSKQSNTKITQSNFLIYSFHHKVYC